MIINTTFFVTDTHSASFLKWLNETYLPKISANEQWLEQRTFKVLSAQESDGVSYCLHLKTDSPETLQQWENLHHKELQREISLLFHENVLAFSTLLEEL